MPTYKEAITLLRESHGTSFMPLLGKKHKPEEVIDIVLDAFNELTQRIPSKRYQFRNDQHREVWACIWRTLQLIGIRGPVTKTGNDSQSDFISAIHQSPTPNDNNDTTMHSPPIQAISQNLCGTKPSLLNKLEDIMSTQAHIIAVQDISMPETLVRYTETLANRQGYTIAWATATTLADDNHRIGRKAAIIIRNPHAINSPYVDLQDQDTRTLWSTGRWCEQRIQRVCSNGILRTAIFACLQGRTSDASDTLKQKQEETLLAAALLRMAQFQDNTTPYYLCTDARINPKHNSTTKHAHITELTYDLDIDWTAPDNTNNPHWKPTTPDEVKADTCVDTILTNDAGAHAIVAYRMSRQRDQHSDHIQVQADIDIDKLTILPIQ